MLHLDILRKKLQEVEEALDCIENTTSQTVVDATAKAELKQKEVQAQTKPVQELITPSLAFHAPLHRVFMDQSALSITEIVKKVAPFVEHRLLPGDRKKSGHFVRWHKQVSNALRQLKELGYLENPRRGWWQIKPIKPVNSIPGRSNG